MFFKRQLDSNLNSELDDLLPENLEKKYLGRCEKFSEAIGRKENINKFCKVKFLFKLIQLLK